MREHAADPRPYEMMVVIAPDVAEDGLQAAIDRVSGYVTNQGGTILTVNNQNPWGRRRLAYPINDFRDAFYILYEFDAPAEAIVEIERDIKLDEQVIRHLVVRYDEMAEQDEQPRRGQRGTQLQEVATQEAAEAPPEEVEPAGEVSAAEPEAMGEAPTQEPTTADDSVTDETAEAEGEPAEA